MTTSDSIGKEPPGLRNGFAPGRMTAAKIPTSIKQKPISIFQARYERRPKRPPAFKAESFKLLIVINYSGYD